MNKNDVTIGMMIRNEEYWIHYVLRDILTLFEQCVIIDTGSTDQTLDIIKHTVQTTNSRLKLIEENYGDDAEKIGNSPNILREEIQTEWMFLVDGDEIWRTEQLYKLLELANPTDLHRVMMVGGRNIDDRDGVLWERTHDTAHYDRLFRPEIRWIVKDYPFQSYGLGNSFPSDRILHMPANTVYHYHVRKTRRSSKDDDAFFRNRKEDYFPYEEGWNPLPELWHGELGMWSNPYIGKSA